MDNNTSLIVLFMAIGALGCAFGAAQKHRNIGGWIFAGAMFPLIALVAVFCLPPLEKEEIA